MSGLDAGADDYLPKPFEGISLDDWGYPVIRPGDIPTQHVAHARRAASACPKLAPEIRRMAR